MPRRHATGHPGLWQRWIGRCGRPIHHLGRAGASVAALRRWAAALLLGLALPGLAWAQHFDVELRTSNGPVAGSRITTDFYGDLGLAGLLPIDAVTGYKIFTGYFGDLEGGPLQTDDPGFQAFAGTFLRREEVHCRALGTLQHWNPATGRWGPAAADLTVALFGGIPLDVIVGYTENPAAWQAQYDFHAAGTRFSTTGIQGPLTAVIDDASSRGAFHAHLDWKISAVSGTPPAGAYLVTLSLWSPTLVNGQPKYLASEPIHFVFERGISEAQMAEAISARVRPPAPARCEAQPLAWQVAGSGCSADAPATASGQAVQLDDSSAPAIGRASFQCSDGQWGSATGASCRPLQACSAQTLDWQAGGLACSGVAAGTAPGQLVIATDTSLPTLGSARFSCQDGQWSAPADASCAPPPPRDCAAQVQTWQLGPATCQAPLAAGVAGSTGLATDSTAPATGSARYRCDDGSWQRTELLACAPPRACRGETLVWQVAGETCSAEAAPADAGMQLQLVDSTAPALGRAPFACDDGRWIAAGPAQCAVPPPRDCMGQAQTWTVAGTSCQAQLPAGTAGSLVTATDGTAPALGSARYQCNDGSWALAEAPVCAVPRACAGETLAWQVDGQTCSAAAAGAASGETVLLDDQTAPTLGSAQARCSDGRWSAPSNARCSMPPPADCGAQVQAWQRNGAACQATLGAAPAGTGATATDSVGPATGAARYRCDAGRWQLDALLSCATPRACASETLAWTVGADTCSALAAATESGQSVLLDDREAPAVGGAEARCDDGRFSVVAGAACAVPRPPACPAQALAWTVGDAECSASTGSAPSGETVLLSDTIGPTTGSASLRCDAGRWSAPTSTRCERPPRDCPAQPAAWTVGTLRCEALLPATGAGQSVTGQDTTLATLGSARFGCVDGQWGAPASATCGVPDCPAQLLDWTHAGQACQAALPRTASGAVALALDSSPPAVGWARAQCQAGQWQAPFSAQCGAWLRDAPRAQPRAPWQAPSRPPWAPP